jgi:hypothetical protein
MHLRNRADSHHTRVDAGHRRPDERTEWLDPELFGFHLARDHKSGRPVVDPTRVPGRDRAVRPEHRLQRGKLLGRCLRPRVLVTDELPRRNQLVGETARDVGSRPTSLRAQCKRVLLLARHLPLRGDVLAGLAHALARIALRVPRVDEPPAERRVVERAVAALECSRRLRRDERRATHRLHAARDEEVTVACDHRMASTHYGRQARSTEAVHGHSGDAVRQPREQSSEARDVAVVLARLVRAPEPDVFDLT